MIAITFLLRKQPHLSDDEFHTYWREQHGPLVRSHADALGIRRYIQLHTLESGLGQAIAQSRDCEPAGYDGIVLVWFDDEDALVAAASTPEGMAAGAALLEDEKRFLDLPNCQLWLSDDNTVVA